MSFNRRCIIQQCIFFSKKFNVSFDYVYRNISCWKFLILKESCNFKTLDAKLYFRVQFKGGEEEKYLFFLNMKCFYNIRI